MKKAVASQFIYLVIATLSALNAQMPHAGSSAFPIFPDAGGVFSVTTLFSRNNTSLQIGYKLTPNWIIYVNGGHLRRHYNRGAITQGLLITNNYGIGAGFQSRLNKHMRLSLLVNIEKRFVEKTTLYYRSSTSPYSPVAEIVYIIIAPQNSSYRSEVSLELFRKRIIFYKYPNFSSQALLSLAASDNVHFFFSLKYDRSYVDITFTDKLKQANSQISTTTWDSRFYLRRIEPGFGIRINVFYQTSLFFLVSTVGQQYETEDQQVSIQYLPDKKNFVTVLVGANVRLRCNRTIPKLK